MPRPTADKLIPWGRLADLGATLRADGKRIVFTNGCFDVLHAGHAAYLAQARAIGDVLVVGLNSDESVRRLKGPSRPAVEAEDRAALLGALEAVDYVTVFDDADPIRTLQALRPHLHVKGGDYQADHLPETSAVRAGGGEVVILPFLEGRSTTRLLERLRGVEPRSSARELHAIAIIPARYASSRFPGKALATIAGRTMIDHVYERASRARSLAEVWVATDDARIRNAVISFGGRVVMTRPDHPSGTDRIAEAAQSLKADVVVNVQGDEPLLDPEEIDAVIEPFRADPELVMTTAATPIRDPRDVLDPNVVKVVLDGRGDALYFSRLPVPYHRSGETGHHLRHLGLYAYRREFLFTYAALPPTPLERAEALEQLRALENGYRIRVVMTEHVSLGVDTPADLERARAMLERADAPGTE
jgi:3-deoxy-manno-octulosonate cytidylyltransferase (CMP-KDO synthetase)